MMCSALGVGDVSRSSAKMLRFNTKDMLRLYTKNSLYPTSSRVRDDIQVLRNDYKIRRKHR